MTRPGEHGKELEGLEETGGPRSLVRLSSLKTSRFGGLVGDSDAIRAVFGRLERAAETDATMLFEGERGTGKKEAARAVHGQSARSSGPFIVVSCAEHPAELEAHLFGDATRDEPGVFERASKGTVYLEDVGELSSDAQAKLLRLLEQKTLCRIGSDEAIEVDVRIIGGTPEDLRKRVQEGAFRSELYFRLSVMRITFPALAERREDFVPIVRTMLEQRGASEEQIEQLTSDAFIEPLKRKSWPDNVLGLQAFIDDAMAHTAGVQSMVPHEPPAPFFGIDASVNYAESRKRAIAEFERQYLRALLDRTNGNVSRAAREAGIDRVYMHRLMRRHQIRR